MSDKPETTTSVAPSEPKPATTPTLNESTPAPLAPSDSQQAAAPASSVVPGAEAKPAEPTATPPAATEQKPSAPAENAPTTPPASSAPAAEVKPAAMPPAASAAPVADAKPAEPTATPPAAAEQKPAASAESKPATPAVSPAPTAEAKPAEATASAPVSAQQQPAAASAPTPPPTVTETSVNANVSDAAMKEHLKTQGLTIEDIAETYLFSDPKSDRDRLIAQTLLFSDYIENNTFRLVGGNIQSVLDLGCGEGQLTAIFKKVYPDADIIGVDIDTRALEIAKQNQDKLPIYGSRIQYAAANIEEKIPEGPFDLIHISLVLLHTSNPAKVLELAKKSLKPGGHLWIKEVVTDLKIQHPAYYKFADLMGRAMTKAGRHHLMYMQLPQMLADLGFYDIKVEKENYPISHDSLSGRISMGVILGMFRNATKMVSRMQGIPEEELIGLYNDMCRDANRLNGMYTLMNFIGRRSGNILQGPTA